MDQLSGMVKTMKNHFIGLCFLVLVGWVNAQALPSGASAMNEEFFMISNGQGISSPSFWNGLEGENPAGLVFNQSTKLQIGAGSYSENGLIGGVLNNTGKSFTYGSGALIIGNGVLGAGLEYQNFNNYFGSADNLGKINWAVAGRLEAIRTTIGFASHATLNGGGISYDAGVMIEPFRQIRLGFMIPHFTITGTSATGKATIAINTFAGGITYHWDDSVDVVVDADYNSESSVGLLKPGISFHENSMSATAAYGLRYLGNSTVILTTGLSLGFGYKLAESLLLSYEYQGVLEHRLGLTLRFN